MTLCVYLKPERPVADAAAAYARRLAGMVPTPLVVGPTALAHLTLVHLSGMDHDAAPALWARAASALDARYEIEGPFYLSIVPFPDESGHNYVRVEVGRTDALDRAQGAMLDLAAEFGAAVTNLTGPAWRPHLTLAVIDQLPPRLPPLPEVLASAWMARPAVGEIGPFRHVEHELHGA